MLGYSNKKDRRLQRAYDNMHMPPFMVFVVSIALWGIIIIALMLAWDLLVE